jgi:hypothetical protein
MRSIVENYRADAIQSFRNYKKLAERALEQISADDFFQQIDPESNSIAVIVKHIAGNLHSRWRDFLTSDGEKPDRHRDTEFELIDDTRESLMQFWETGWQTLFDAIEPLTADDFARTVTIRGEPHTVIEAINRQLTHYSMHIGQIVFLAKHFKGAEWKTLSVPRNRSDQFNQFLADKQAAGQSNTNLLNTVAEFANNADNRRPRSKPRLSVLTCGFSPMKSVSILGSTGSIGCNTLKVIEHLGDMRVVAMAAGRNMAKFAEQIARFKPELVSCETQECAETLERELHALNAYKPRIELKTKGLIEVASHPEAVIVVSASFGAVGFIPTL